MKKELLENLIHVCAKETLTQIKEFHDVARRQQTKIALDTLKLSDAGANIMGGMTKEEARNFLKSIGYSDERLAAIENSKITEEASTPKLLGGQPNQPLKPTEYKLVQLQDNGDVAIVRDSDTGKSETWVRHTDRPASYALKIGNYFYEFASSSDTRIDNQGIFEESNKPQNAWEYHEDSQGAWCKECGVKAKIENYNNKLYYVCGNKQCKKNHIPLSAMRHDMLGIAEEETKGAAAPPAEGQGTSDFPAIPKDKNALPPEPSDKETPPLKDKDETPPEKKGVLQGVMFVNPKNKSIFKKFSPHVRAYDDATINNELYRFVQVKAGGPMVKIALNTTKMVKDALKNPASVVYLYIEKDEDTGELQLRADKSAQVAQNNSCQSSDLAAGKRHKYPIVPPYFDKRYMENEIDPLRLFGTQQTAPTGLGEQLKISIKKVIKELFEDEIKTDSESSTEGGKEASDKSNIDPIQQAKLDRQASHDHAEEVKKKTLELDAAKKKLDFYKKEIDQLKRIEIPNKIKELQALKGWKGNTPTPIK